MRHLMPIVTPRWSLRPPTLGDLDSIQTAKEEAWPICSVGWPGPSNTNGRGQAMENLSTNDGLPESSRNRLAGFHRINGISSSEPRWMLR